jgi:hypothetical protein
MALFQQKGEVVGPNAGHFVEEDQGTLETIVDLFVLGSVSSWIEGRNMLDSKIEILYQKMACQQKRKEKREKRSHHLPEFVGSW